MLLSEALEAIDYKGSNNPLFSGMVRLYDEAIKLYKTDFIGARRALDSIENHIAKHTGITVRLVVEDPGIQRTIFFSRYSATVELPRMPDMSNILYPGVMDSLVNGSIPKVDKISKGTVDPNTGRVGGFFSEIVFRINITSIMFDGGVTPDALAAITLHELGHAWTSIVTIGANVITSALMLGCADFFDRTNDSKHIERFVGEIKKRFPNTNLSPEETEDAIKARFALGYQDIFTQTLGELAGVGGVTLNKNMSHELLADQFANRWGAGVSLAQALNTLDNKNTVLGTFGIANPYTRGLFNVFLAYMSLWKTPTAVIARLGKQMGYLEPGLPTAFELVRSYILPAVGLATILRLLPQSHPSIKNRIDSLIRDNISLLKETKDKDMARVLLNEIDALKKEKGKVYTFNEITQVFSSLADEISRRNARERGRVSVSQRENNALYELMSRLETLA